METYLMAKRLAVKVGEFTNQQGETKGEYIRLGALMAGNEGGEYLLLDPTVNLAGALTKQNMMNHKNGKQVRDSLMVSVFDDSNGKQQGGQQPASNNSGPDYGSNETDYYDDDIPF
jgi:single-stranded DNA-binding protein